MRPIITLLSDFGLDDTFVGQMKGAALAYCRDATMVDLTHHVPPQSIAIGAFHLRAAWRSFPFGTVHLAVVDPGVGTSRRAIALEYEGHRFVLPDNGLITAVLGDGVPDAIVEIGSPATPNARISRTFHGRDVFAPAAGRLAAGNELGSLGPGVDPRSVTRIALPHVDRKAGVVRGEVILVDRFGNCMTNIDEASLGTLQSVNCVCAGRFGVPGIARAYGDVAPAQALALISSMGTLEIAVREGSASERFGINAGDPVEVRVEDPPEGSGR